MRGGRHHFAGCRCPFCATRARAEAAPLLVTDDNELSDVWAVAHTSTPLDEGWISDLLPAARYITTWREVDAAESVGVARGRAWLRSRSDLDVGTLLSQSFLRELHQQMFGKVWVWAGKYRQREVNISRVSPHQIADTWEQLLGNARYWLDRDVYPLDEACVRLFFQQREIQPFTNGNTRHARLMINELARLTGSASPGEDRFPFGRSRQASPADARARYLAAFEQARRNNLAPLLEVARSGTS